MLKKKKSAHLETSLAMRSSASENNLQCFMQVNADIISFIIQIRMMGL